MVVKVVLILRVVYVLSTIVNFPLIVNHDPLGASLLTASRFLVAVLNPAGVGVVTALVAAVLNLVDVFSSDAAPVHIVEILAGRCAKFTVLINPLSVAHKFLFAGIMTLSFFAPLKI